MKRMLTRVALLLIALFLLGPTPQARGGAWTFEEGAGQLDGNGVTDDFDGTHFVWSAATTGASSGSSSMSAPSSSSPY